MKLKFHTHIFYYSLVCIALITTLAVSGCGKASNTDQKATASSSGDPNNSTIENQPILRPTEAQGLEGIEACNGSRPICLIAAVARLREATGITLSRADFEALISSHFTISCDPLACHVTRKGIL